MKITELKTTDCEIFEQIRSCGWEAGQFLYELIQSGRLKSYLGENTKIFVLTDADKLVSFCTLSDIDDIQPTELTPWIGFVFTSPEYRGKRLVGKLIQHAEQEAAARGYDKTYISTSHTGLYEKYGYTFLRQMKDVHGEGTRVYFRNIGTEEK